MSLGKWGLLAVLVLAAAFFAYDLTLDILGGAEAAAHFLVEGVVFLAVLAAMVYEFRRIRALGRILAHERGRNARLSGKLFEAMHQQFGQWRLTASEIEVALLLIKGHSMHEIADLRGVHEKTVRQQATSIYAKSGTSGRHELVAGFIEDLIAGD